MMMTKSMAPTDASTLIVYFSLSGTTARAARRLQTLLQVPLVELQPLEPYPKHYEDYVRRADAERLAQLLPALRPTLLALEKYQTIWVGFPTWWHQPPQVIATFFAYYDLAGKTIIPFTTNMSDPIDEALPVLAKWAEAAGASLEPGLRVTTDQGALAKFVAANSHRR